MNTIKFNDHSYQVYSFNKNTYFNENGISSTASCLIDTNDIPSLYTLAQDNIQTLQIYHDNELIYSLTDLDGRLVAIEEYLSENKVNINLNFNFDVIPTIDDELPTDNEEET